MARPPNMLGRKEGLSIDVPVELASSTKVLEELGAGLDGSDAVPAVVDGVEVGGPVGWTSPAPARAGLGMCNCGAEEEGGGCFYQGWVPG